MSKMQALRGVPLTAALLGGSAAFEDAFYDSEEPRWFLMMLDDGYELQRSGLDMSEVSNAIEQAIMAKNDPRYECDAGKWAAGLRRRWLSEPQTGRPLRWGPHPPDYILEFASEVAEHMRKRWLRELCPTAVANSACERARAEAERPEVACSREALDREQQEAQAQRLSRSRTPQRKYATVAHPEQRSHSQPSVQRRLLSQKPKANHEENDPEREQDHDGEESALVVRKWYLKKKTGGGGYLRRLVANPAAWNPGPGVTVTKTTRHLLPMAGRSGGSASSSDNRPWRSRECRTSTATDPGETRTSEGETAESEPQDIEDAQFIWRAMLQLDSDEEAETDEPGRMPGFINEPYWSSVWETLNDQSEPAFRLMRRALPGFIHLLGKELQNIVDQVSHRRGIAEDGEADRQNEPGSASAGRPGASASSPDEVEVLVEDEDDLAGLMQKDLSTRPPEKHEGAERDRMDGHEQAHPKYHELNSKICQYRDDLEQRWVNGDAVGGMLEALGRALGLHSKEQVCTQAQEILMAVAAVVGASEWCLATTTPRPLSPAQEKWVTELAAIIQEMMQTTSEAGDETHLMQRTVTGMLTGPKSLDLVRQLHQELAERSDEEATALSTRLMRAIQGKAAEVDDWERLQAVLVAHTGKRGSSWCGEVRMEQETWVTRWMSLLLERIPHQGHDTEADREVASSSTEVPQLGRPTAQGERPEDQQARLEEQQNLEDIELFKWHSSQIEAEEKRKEAQEAQAKDRAALQAHLGWSSGPPQKRVRLTLEAITTTSNRYMEWEFGEGDKLQIKMEVAQVPHGGRLLQGGRPVERHAGLEELRKEEERIARHGPQPAAAVPRRTGMFSTEDPAIRPYYDAWRDGRIDFDGLITAVGGDAAMYIKEAAEVAELDLDTVPDVDVSGRMAWQQGSDVESILRSPGCRADYARWEVGDLKDADIVDKWGGDVYRRFEGWFVHGAPPGEDVPEPDDRANNDHGAMETMPEEAETVPWPAPPPGMEGDPTKGGSKGTRRRGWGTSSSAS